MNKNILRITAALLVGFSISSCSDNNDNGYNPFDEEKTGEFVPSSIIIEKHNNQKSISESWSGIERDSLNRITQYNYNYKIEEKGDGNIEHFFSQADRSYCKIYYHKNHLGNELITTMTDLQCSKLVNGINENYRQELRETITLNADGYIESITTTISHYQNGATEPVIKTSDRTFTYNGDYCTSSTYRDDNSTIAYTYNWDVYQLNSIATRKENHTNGSVELTLYEYEYDDDSLYSYSGTEPLPFIQKNLPCIFASMGYLGRCTPYLLDKEKLTGSINYVNESVNLPEENNDFELIGNTDTKLKYTATSNVYNSYDVIFCK